MNARALLLTSALMVLQSLSGSALALAAPHKHKATPAAARRAGRLDAEPPRPPTACRVRRMSMPPLTSWRTIASGKVLAERDADKRVEPASLTKLMTCYAVFHALKAGSLKLTDMVTISEHAWRAEGSRTFVQVGSQVPAETLIKGMIVQSGNDATIALAERVGGTEPAFVQIMNEYAQRSA